jgi:hypothetical protein
MIEVVVLLVAVIGGSVAGGSGDVAAGRGDEVGLIAGGSGVAVEGGVEVG